MFIKYNILGDYLLGLYKTKLLLINLVKFQCHLSRVWFYLFVIMDLKPRASK